MQRWEIEHHSRRLSNTNILLSVKSHIKKHLSQSNHPPIDFPPHQATQRLLRKASYEKYLISSQQTHSHCARLSSTQQGFICARACPLVYLLSTYRSPCHAMLPRVFYSKYSFGRASSPYFQLTHSVV